MQIFCKVLYSHPHDLDIQAKIKKLKSKKEKMIEGELYLLAEDRLRVSCPFFPP